MSKDDYTPKSDPVNPPKLNLKLRSALSFASRNLVAPAYIHPDHPSKKLYRELEARGLITYHWDGNYYLTDLGRAVLRAADAGPISPAPKDGSK